MTQTWNITQKKGLNWMPQIEGGKGSGEDGHRPKEEPGGDTTDTEGPGGV